MINKKGGDKLLTIAKFDRYDLVNSPKSDKAAFTIWFSGCSRKCEDCYNETLWNKSAGQGYDVNAVESIVTKSCGRTGTTDIVLLGGEPLEQDINDLSILLRHLHGYGYQIWLYTGFEFDQINSNIMKYLYTIKCGRYDKSLKTPNSIVASSNQKFYRHINDKWIEISL